MISNPTLVSLIKKKSIRKGEQDRVSKYKVFRFSADFRNKRSFRKYVCLLKPSVRVVAYPEEPLCSGQLGVKATKVEEVQTLAKYQNISAVPL